jgi:hypothetical protein
LKNLQPKIVKRVPEFTIVRLKIHFSVRLNIQNIGLNGSQMSHHVV